VIGPRRHLADETRPRLLLHREGRSGIFGHRIVEGGNTGGEGLVDGLGGCGAGKGGDR
jgi:hypothetical protein